MANDGEKRWGWLRVARLPSGGLKIGPLHLSEGCQYLHYSGAPADVVRVLLSAIDGDPILGGLVVCRMCADPLGLALKKRAS